MKAVAIIKQVDDEAEHPDQLARRLVGSVIKPAEDVDVGDDEEEARAVHVRVAKQPSRVDVAHDELVDRIERAVGRGGDNASQARCRSRSGWSGTARRERRNSTSN